ncbi:nucleolar protein 9-like isoform X2 [Acanthaster planci]|uniref:Nucleolar protein 9-like isoform X2 n=1 Tax=Acanthaster planci TaxID=133434 RepID=A0A8B7XNJ8_ACAPL|nr:nucleolar protein 9-like isoform X2 [Acanthaster planci]
MAAPRHISRLPTATRKNKFKFEKGKHHVEGTWRKDGKHDGRVGRLDEHTMGYYRRVADTIKDGFPDEIEQGLFLDNVFNQMETEEVKLCQNQTVSRILEDILLLAQPTHLRRFLTGVLEEFEVVVKDRFAGHVIQRALLQTTKFLDDEDEGAVLQEKVLSMADLLITNLTTVLMDTYGNHILRTMVQVLGGFKVPDLVARSRLSREQQDKETNREIEKLLTKVPERMQQRLKKITNTILSAENFNEYVLHRTSSPVLEVLLLILQQSYPGLCHRLCQAILKKSKVMSKNPSQSDQRVPVVLTDNVGSHLFEIVIEVISDESFSEVYSQCFSHHLLGMALHPVANFVLQKLIKRAAKEEEFSEIFDKLLANIEAILGVNHMGVVLRLAEACIHHPAKQSDFLKGLLSAFNCWEPRKRQATCVLLIAGMVTHEVFFSESKEDQEQDKATKPGLSEVNLHGSLLLQQLLKFSHCGPIIAGFMALQDADLIAMACSPSGSYLLEAFMTSSMVSEKKKDRLGAQLKTNCFKIACHKTGSRCVEAIFKAASLRTKSTLVQALAEKDKQLQSDHFGKFVHRNCAVGLFKLRQRDWEELQGRESRKRKLFADIIGDDQSSKTKKKISVDDIMKPVSKYPDELMALEIAEESKESSEDDDIDDIFRKISKPASMLSESPHKDAKRKRSSKAKESRQYVDTEHGEPTAKVDETDSQSSMTPAKKSKKAPKKRKRKDVSS